MVLFYQPLESWLNFNTSQMKLIYLETLSILFIACSSQAKIKKELTKEEIYSNKQAMGPELSISFEKGSSHNHPSFVIWMEDLNGKFIETLFITKSVGTGEFNYGKTEKGKWVPALKRYPSSLPYWGHRRGILSSDSLYIPDPQTKTPDAVTGSTPKSSFILNTKLSNPELKEFKIYFEVNQTWDYNEYWTNNKFSDNETYKASCQPSLIYSANIDLNQTTKTWELQAIGHGHYAGETGELFENLSTLTTAKQIAEKITVHLKEN
ncbi:hypothetical protein ACFLSA_05530 [Bacteroidota bacterium]